MLMWSWSTSSHGGPQCHLCSGIGSKSKTTVYSSENYQNNTSFQEFTTSDSSQQAMVIRKYRGSNEKFSDACSNTSALLKYFAMGMKGTISQTILHLNILTPYASNMLNLMSLKLRLCWINSEEIRSCTKCVKTTWWPKKLRSSGAVYFVLVQWCCLLWQIGKKYAEVQKGRGARTGQWGEREKNCTLLISIHLREIHDR